VIPFNPDTPGLKQRHPGVHRAFQSWILHLASVLQQSAYYHKSAQQISQGVESNDHRMLGIDFQLLRRGTLNSSPCIQVSVDLSVGVLNAHQCIQQERTTEISDRCVSYQAELNALDTSESIFRGMYDQLFRRADLQKISISGYRQRFS
jgi:hypothetical protein